MFDSLVILQLLLLLSCVFYCAIPLLFAAWLMAGIYLFGIGMYLLFHDSDILVGFLWLIDLGVGLIFLTFVVYLFAYLSQKAAFELPARTFSFALYFLIFVFFYYTLLGFPVSNNTNKVFSTFWFFLLSWYDYYEIFNLNSATDLLVLRELYFHSNSFEFFAVSFIGFYGIVACVLLTMVIKRSIHYFSKNLYDALEFTQKPHMSFFIRNQNFLKQRNTSAGSRVWRKNKTIKPIQ